MLGVIYCFVYNILFDTVVPTVQTLHILLLEKVRALVLVSDALMISILSLANRAHISLQMFDYTTRSALLRDTVAYTIT